jgi:pilus assembly protein FimV
MGRKIAAIALSLGCLHTGTVMALGLGEIKLESFLNEPLKAEVDLLNTGSLHADEIKVRLATREDFEKMGLERAYFLTGIKFEVDIEARGGPRIIVTSDDPVLEPYLDFIVEARWPTGRLLREYTVLVDPPVFDQTSPVISASQRVEEVEGVPAPAKKTEEPAAAEKSGTQVKMRKSDLAPGEMPERDFSAETSPTPVPGRRYMIHRDDTLWEIAQQARPADTSVHQTMLDIQRLNPSAFIDGNINRIKAGYIVYLPDVGDISSEDLASALAEVKQQNEDWRAGRASEPVASSGPTLRISVDEPGVAAPEGKGETAEVTERDTAASAIAMEEADRAALESSETGERLEAMEEQVDTLTRIVSLKDEQIAALQAALAEAQGEEQAIAEAGEVVTEQAAAEGAGEQPLEAESEGPAAEAEQGVAEEAVVVTEETPVEVAEEEGIEAQVAVAPPPAKPAPAAPPAGPAPDEGGTMNYLLYALGAAVLAVLAFVFLRRRGEDQEQAVAAPVAAPAEDVFADVKLKEQALEVEAPVEQAPPIQEPPEPEPELPEAEPELELETETELSARDNRGYGEHKHDEYASDVDAGDALAEADIYIAYGRFPQAIDLLSNALVNEPGNAAYRLKLLELYAETGDQAAARGQFEELRSIGDEASLERAEAVLADLGQEEQAGTDDSRRFIQSEPEAEASAAPEQAPPADLLAESDTPLEADFSGLEIEEAAATESAPPEDLDLTADFAGSELAQGEEEDLVIAAESNGLSTKLDLARAYLDMGDEDGARQILEEVIAEGGDELKAEAGALLERIG